MKILMIAPQPFFQPRGTPLSVLHRLKALSLLGHHVDLVTYHIGEDIPIDNVTIHRTVVVPFVKDISIGPSLKKILCDIYIWKKSISLLSKNKYDLLHTHEEAGFMGIVLKKRYNIPHLYDMHSSLPQQLANFKKGNIGFIKNIFKNLEKKTLDSADGIITICSDLQKTVKKIDPDLDPVLIENVADNSIVFGSDKGEDVVKKLMEKYNIPENHQVVLYTGTFEKYQGIELLLQAAEACLKSSEKLIFLLVGGQEAQINKMELLADSLGITDRVIFTGMVHPRKIVTFYEIATIIASPRIVGTNSPLKIYSYLRSGKPIVATNCYTHTQVLDDNVALLAEPEPEKMANAILLLLNDAVLRDKFVQAAQKLSDEKYSYENYLEKTKSVYAKAVKI